jgi:hypothetical protein
MYLLMARCAPIRSFEKPFVNSAIQKFERRFIDAGQLVRRR